MSAQVRPCDISAACLGGSDEEVLDCAAATVWRSEYTREYPDYGTPDLSSECKTPQVWMTCDNGEGERNRSTGSRGLSQPTWDAPRELRAPRASTSSVLVGPQLAALPALPDVGALLNGTRGLLAAWRGEPAQPRLASRSPAERRLASPGQLSGFPMPGNVSDECTLTGGIKAFPLLTEFFTEVMPTIKALLVMIGLVVFAQAVAFGAGAFMGKTLYETMPVAGMGYAQPGYASPMVPAPSFPQPGNGAQGPPVVQGTVVQGSVVQGSSAQGQYGQGQYGQGQGQYGQF